MNKKRVVVTGLGIVSPIGIGIDPFWRNLTAGRTGIGKIDLFDTKGYRTHEAGEVKDFNPSKFIDDPEHLSRTSQFALTAAKLAVKDSCLEKKGNFEDAAVIMGAVAMDAHVVRKINSTGGKRGQNRALRARLAKEAAIDTPAVVVSREFGIKNLAYTVATACSAGNYAITLGYDLIQEGKAKTAFCGGVDSFSQAIFAGFNRLFIVSPDKCRPFDKNRNGMIIAEGAGVLILEDMDTALARGARIYSEVLGYGVSCGAHNLVSPTKNGIKLAMKRAVKNSGLTNKDIDYINAHGTATPNNDRNEAKAIRELFGPHAEKVAVSSNKSVLGHALSAASIFEAVSCCLSIRDEIIPPTMNYETPDPECRLNIIANKHKKKKINIAMNNSFAFGGNNACVIFGRLKTRGKKCRRA